MGSSTSAPSSPPASAGATQPAPEPKTTVATAAPVPSPSPKAVQLAPTPADRSQLGIIKSRKVNSEQLKWVGQSEQQQSGATPAPPAVEKKCRWCCMLFGSGLSLFFSGMVAACFTLFICYRERHRIPLDAQRILRQAAWMTVPSAAVGGSLHFFLADSMWSSRRNNFGTAWFKALSMNTICWVTAIGSGTFFWRYVLRHCGTWGNRAYYRYPVPSLNLETRLLEDPSQVFRGMGWTYWALGVMTGQLGYATSTAAITYNNKPYYMMSPQGPYSRSCTPRWRREALAKAAGMELPPGS
jgi:hypothetical protein